MYIQSKSGVWAWLPVFCAIIITTDTEMNAAARLTQRYNNYNNIVPTDVSDVKYERVRTHVQTDQ